MLIISFALLPSLSIGQDNPVPKQVPVLKKFVYGGGLGLNFGNVTLINLAPSLGYRVSERFLPGISATYSYYHDSKLDISSTIYGGSLFSRYYLLPQLFAHGEYEVLNGDWLIGRDRFNVNSLFVGAGYSQRIAGNVFFNLLGLFNLNDGSFSPYTNPVLRGGFQVGI